MNNFDDGAPPGAHSTPHPELARHNANQGVAYDPSAIEFGLQGVRLLFDPDDPQRLLLRLAPAAEAIAIAIEAALEEHDVLFEESDLAPYLPGFPAALNGDGVRFEYRFAWIQEDHDAGELDPEPIRHLLLPSPAG